MAVRVIDTGQFWWDRGEKIPPERDDLIGYM